MYPDSSQSSDPSWTALLFHAAPKKVLLVRGPLLALALLPLAFLFIWCTADHPVAKELHVWFIAVLGIDFLLCILLTFTLWALAICVFAQHRGSSLAYSLIEWGMAAFWWWLIPIFLLGLWSLS